MCANEIKKPLSNIINTSIDYGTFVDTAKISLCTPLYKNASIQATKCVYQFFKNY